MKRLTLNLVAIFILVTSTVYAQSIEQAKSYIYNQRWKSAEAELTKIVAGNPSDPYANYWLGIAKINNGADNKAVIDFYKQALTNTKNSPLVLAGYGFAEIIEDGTVESGKAKLKEALTLSKGKDTEVTNAVIRANLTNHGDKKYALELAQTAMTGKKVSAETAVLAGRAFASQKNASDAIYNYQNALTITPSYAEALYRQAKLYNPQKNDTYKKKYLELLNQTVALDANYAPALYELFQYYYSNNDAANAKIYYDKYQKVSDAQNDGGYYEVAILYSAKKYQEAINAAKTNLQQQGNKANPQYYKIIASAYLLLNQNDLSKEYIDLYMTKQTPNSITSEDNLLQANIYSKFPSLSSEMWTLIDEAFVEEDEPEKIGIAKRGIYFANELKDSGKLSYWYNQLKTLKGEPLSEYEMYEWGDQLFKLGDFNQSKTVFQEYQKLYPDKAFGYFYAARADQGLEDPNNVTGMAKDNYAKLVAIAKNNPKENIAFLTPAYMYLAYISATIENNKDNAKLYLNELLTIDPTNTNAKEFLAELK